MVIRYQRERPNMEDADLSALMDEDDLNPMYMASKSNGEFCCCAPSGLAISMVCRHCRQVADTATAPAALTQRGDKLWMDFRRTTSFDHQYCGNPPMNSDEWLEKKKKKKRKTYVPCSMSPAPRGRSSARFAASARDSWGRKSTLLPLMRWCSTTSRTTFTVPCRTGSSSDRHVCASQPPFRKRLWRQRGHADILRYGR